MQLYRVKLNEGHLAKPDQMAGEYLGNYSTIDPALYTKSEAQKKANMFGGTIEPFGKNYAIDELKVIQLNRKDISNHLLRELNGRQVFIDTDSDLCEFMYYGDVFDGILGEHTEQTLLSFNQDVIDELLALQEICGEYQYVMLTGV